jgi:hypothetical protein
MIYIPDIVNYQPFYIQTDADAAAIDTTQWGLVAKANPFPAIPNPKQPYKSEWLDADGDDEYTGKMYYEAFEFDVTFYIKTIGDNAGKELIEQMQSFFDKIKSGEFKIYDSYTGLGRRKVRYAGFNEEEYKRRYISGNGWARAIFSITFKVNDPITRVVLKNGTLKENA